MDLQSVTAANNAKNTERKPGSDMGKHDFLLLLSAQLRFQDPLEPKNDSDFAAGLAQFSSLEQMQNMNATLESMNHNQMYSLIGKFVIAEAVVDGKLGEVPGVVDSVFIKAGVAMAQIGEYVVPISSIKEVFNTDNILTAEMLMTTSQSLIGREIIAEVDDKDIEGIVTRIFVDKGSLWAQIDDGSDEPKFVPVNTIVDVREPGTSVHVPKGPKPEKPPEAENIKPDGNGNWIEVCDKGEKELGLWTWDEKEWKWIFTKYEDKAIEEDLEEEAIIPEDPEEEAIAA